MGNASGGPGGTSSATGNATFAISGYVNVSGTAPQVECSTGGFGRTVGFVLPDKINGSTVEILFLERNPGPTVSVSVVNTAGGPVSGYGAAGEITGSGASADTALRDALKNDTPVVGHLVANATCPGAVAAGGTTPSRPLGPNWPMVDLGAVVIGGGLIDIYRRRDRAPKKDCSALVYLDRVEFESIALGLIGGESADTDDHMMSTVGGKAIGPQWDFTVSINDARGQWREMTYAQKQTKELAGTVFDLQELKEGCGDQVEFVYQVTVQAGPGVSGIAPLKDNADTDMTKTYTCEDGTKIEERLTVVLGLGEKGGPGNDAWARFTFVFVGDTICGERPDADLPKQLWQDPDVHPDEQRRRDREKLDPGEHGPKNILLE